MWLKSCRQYWWCSTAKNWKKKKKKKCPTQELPRLTSYAVSQSIKPSKQAFLLATEGSKIRGMRWELISRTIRRNELGRKSLGGSSHGGRPWRRFRAANERRSEKEVEGRRWRKRKGKRSERERKRERERVNGEERRLTPGKTGVGLGVKTR